MTIYGARGLTRREQARELLARAAAEEWGLPGLPALQRLPGGKPVFAAYPQLHFNLSHSGDLALCALDASPVGVDIQVVKPWRAGLFRRVCTPEELDWLEAQADPPSAFALLWALRECRVKESGLGLRTAIRDIRVPRPDTCPCILDGLTFRTWSGEGWAAAACGHSDPPERICWRELGLEPPFSDSCCGKPLRQTTRRNIKTGSHL